MWGTLVNGLSYIVVYWLTHYNVACKVTMPAAGLALPQTWLLFLLGE
jgi:hypothetical protein